MSGNVPAPGDTDLYRIVRAVRELFEGRSNATGTVTLTANASSTAVAAPNCGAGSVPLLVPMTANAAAKIGNGTLHVSAVGNGAFTLSHASNGQTDRIFRFVALG